MTLKDAFGDEWAELTDDERDMVRDDAQSAWDTYGDDAWSYARNIGKGNLRVYVETLKVQHERDAWMGGAL